MQTNFLSYPSRINQFLIASLSIILLLTATACNDTQVTVTQSSPTTTPVGNSTTTQATALPVPTQTITTTQPSATQSLNTLPIPKVEVGVVNSRGERVFTLNLQRGSKEFISGKTTATFGINGDFLGPTLRMNKNEKIVINVTNSLGETSALHWHGLHVPAKVDSGLQQVIQPNQTWQSTFTVLQGAGTYWYHAHLSGKTGQQLYKGLAGLLVVDDEVTTQLNLPKQYGVDDIPLIIQDRQFATNGSFAYLTNTNDSLGMQGNKILVNGVITPTLETRAQLTRLRILNASNARIYYLGFSDNRSFYQIATDGGLLEAPARITRLLLAPGERAEILVDLSKNLNQSINLKSYSSEVSATLKGDVTTRDNLDINDFDVLTIRVTQAANNSARLPTTLTTIKRLSPINANLRAFILNIGLNTQDIITTPSNSTNNVFGDLSVDTMHTMATTDDLSGSNTANRFIFTINNKVLNKSRIDEIITLNAVEVWRIVNGSAMAIPFHIQGVQFLIIGRNGIAPDENENGWKDTVLVSPSETVNLVMQFKDFADTTNSSLFYSQIAEHQDAGMMGQYVISNSNNTGDK